jgi:hypothetical protein
MHAMFAERPALAGGRVPRPGPRLGGLQRGHEPQDHSSSRHPAHAQQVRALRPQPAVCNGIRRCAGGTFDR